MQENDRAPREDVIPGRNPVAELLKSGQEIDSIYIVKGELKGSLVKILAMAKDRGIPVKEVNEIKLDNLTSFANHQGVAAVTAAYAYSTVEEILERAGDQPPFLIVCDDIEDVHNLGALIRTAEACGAHGMIIPKRHGVGLTAVVAKTSAGAAQYLPVARVSNLAQTLEVLKKRGIWTYAADMDGESWCSVDYSGGVALVIGAEGRGVSRLLRESCDFVVSLPMQGKINSLNASVAGGVVMYEIARQRLGLSQKNKPLR